MRSLKKRIAILLVITIVISFALTGCGKGGNYKKATSLFDDGKYQEAAEIFVKLGDYEDSAEMANKCRYEAAKALFDAGSYEEARSAFSDLGEYEKSQEYLADCDHQIMLQKYADVFAALDGKTWYFNGGADNILNSITFSGESTTISQVYFDGNYKHENGSNEHQFIVDDQNLIITMEDGSELKIAYDFSNQTINLNKNEYATIEEIEEGIQGYWKDQNDETIIGIRTVTEKNIYINHGKIISEKAALANGSTSGEYYYYGPYEGTYTLNFGGFDTDMMHGGEWFFNIVDGEIVLLNCDRVCTKTDKLPGQNGYKF